MNSTSTITSGLRFLLSAACLVIVIAGLRGASTILVPLALALFVAVVSLPLLNLVRQRGIPTGIAILFVVLFDASALFLFGWLVTLAAVEVRNEVPQYVMRVGELIEEGTAWLAARGIEVETAAGVWFPGQETGVDPTPIFDTQFLLGLVPFLLRGATDVITGVVTMAFLVTLIFVFMLAEAPNFPRKLRLIAGRKGDDLGRSEKIVREIQHYLAIKTLISAATGLTIGVATWGIGLDFPLLWGLLAFLLNFIPNVGSIIAAVPAVLVALLQAGPGTAALVAVLYLGVNALFGNFLEPMLVGRQLGIPTIFIILSLVFWGWLWGPIGMFLSVPLTMAVKIGLENSEDFRWIAVLMTSERRVGRSETATAPVPPSSSVSRRKKSPIG